uniref:Uncharacterized protein n=1 Tax=Timema poppense TaxID=170557 RepID=A0A7R9D9L2_TIMPO|nr:unnamed protein product [Timema poppensis]
MMIFFGLMLTLATHHVTPLSNDLVTCSRYDDNTPHLPEKYAGDHPPQMRYPLDKGVVSQYLTYVYRPTAGRSLSSLLSNTFPCVQSGMQCMGDRSTLVECSDNLTTINTWNCADIFPRNEFNNVTAIDVLCDTIQNSCVAFVEVLSAQDDGSEREDDQIGASTNLGTSSEGSSSTSLEDSPPDVLGRDDVSLESDLVRKTNSMTNISISNLTTSNDEFPSTNEVMDQEYNQNNIIDLSNKEYIDFPLEYSDFPSIDLNEFLQNNRTNLANVALLNRTSYNISEKTNISLYDDSFDQNDYSYDSFGEVPDVVINRKECRRQGIHCADTETIVDCDDAFEYPIFEMSCSELLQPSDGDRVFGYCDDQESRCVINLNGYVVPMNVSSFDAEKGASICQEESLVCADNETLVACSDNGSLGNYAVSCVGEDEALISYCDHGLGGFIIKMRMNNTELEVSPMETPTDQVPTVETSESETPAVDVRIQVVSIPSPDIMPPYVYDNYFTTDVGPQINLENTTSMLYFQEPMENSTNTIQSTIDIIDSYDVTEDVNHLQLGDRNTSKHNEIFGNQVKSGLEIPHEDVKDEIIQKYDSEAEPSSTLGQIYEEYKTNEINSTQSPTNGLTDSTNQLVINYVSDNMKDSVLQANENNTGTCKYVGWQCYDSQTLLLCSSDLSPQTTLHCDTTDHPYCDSSLSKCLLGDATIAESPCYKSGLQCVDNNTLIYCSRGLQVRYIVLCNRVYMGATCDEGLDTCRPTDQSNIHPQSLTSSLKPFNTLIQSKPTFPSINSFVREGIPSESYTSYLPQVTTKDSQPISQPTTIDDNYFGSQTDSYSSPQSSNNDFTSNNQQISQATSETPSTSQLSTTNKPTSNHWSIINQPIGTSLRTKSPTIQDVPEQPLFLDSLYSPSVKITNTSTIYPISSSTVVSDTQPKRCRMPGMQCVSETELGACSKNMTLKYVVPCKKLLPYVSRTKFRIYCDLTYNTCSIARRVMYGS